MSTRAFSKASRRVVSGCRDALHKPGPRCQRTYYSYDHPAAVGAFGSTEEAILSAAYKHVPEYGFSNRALGYGARDAGYLDISPSVLPDGAFSLIRYHLVSQREMLTIKSQELFKDQESLRPGARARDLTWARLLANRDVIHHWQEVRQCYHEAHCRPAKRHAPLIPTQCKISAGTGRHGTTQSRTDLAQRARKALR